MSERLRWFALMTVVSIMLTACASKPIEVDDSLSTLSPSDPAERFSEADARVLWGGVIVSSSNLEDTTQLEVLAYPLNNRQKPQQSKSAQGRFLIVAEGYLETVDYAAGRLVTVLGLLDGTTSGLVGESTYQYPTVTTEQLHLWDEADGRSRTGFSFGLGISL